MSIVDLLFSFLPQAENDTFILVSQGGTCWQSARATLSERTDLPVLVAEPIGAHSCGAKTLLGTLKISQALRHVDVDYIYVLETLEVEWDTTDSSGWPHVWRRVLPPRVLYQ